MSPATSDCLGPYFSVFSPIIAFMLTFLGSFNSCIFYVFFPIIAFMLTFLGSFNSCIFSVFFPYLKNYRVYVDFSGFF